MREGIGGERRDGDKWREGGERWREERRSQLQ